MRINTKEDEARIDIAQEDKFFQRAEELLSLQKEKI